jgi:hypothetical protein
VLEPATQRFWGAWGHSARRDGARSAVAAHRQRCVGLGASPNKAPPGPPPGRPPGGPVQCAACLRAMSGASGAGVFGGRGAPPPLLKNAPKDVSSGFWPSVGPRAVGPHSSAASESARWRIPIADKFDKTRQGKAHPLEKLRLRGLGNGRRTSSCWSCAMLETSTSFTPRYFRSDFLELALAVVACAAEISHLAEHSQVAQYNSVVAISFSSKRQPNPPAPRNVRGTNPEQ